MDKIKMMTKTMVACAQNMVKELEDQASSNKNGETQVELDKQFQELTADIISHTAFGSSYKLGIEAFHAQKELQEIAVKSLLNVQIPGFSYLPTKGNWRKLTLEKKLRGTLMQIIQSRLSSKGSGYGSDLLGLMLEACIATDQGREQHQLSLSIDEIIHECKTFFFAGHETTSLLLTWTVFLLSVYPEWQARLRLEALRECGKENPNGDNLSKLKEARKLMSMVFLETLRLYGPALFLQRKPLTDITVGETKIPKDHAIIIPSAIMHRDKEIWGDDADEFNPLRFQNGVTRAAKVPHALLAFSIGPRSCIGQNFAMLEAKSVMAMILKKGIRELTSGVGDREGSTTTGPLHCRPSTAAPLAVGDVAHLAQPCQTRLAGRLPPPSPAGRPASSSPPVPGILLTSTLSRRPDRHARGGAAAAARNQVAWVISSAR
uniref:Uncharacterized protein n=1 Tax=Oryza barthii TaxID=65489 RepID=A0A0D3FIY7_9ORYZ